MVALTPSDGPVYNTDYVRQARVLFQGGATRREVARALNVDEGVLTYWSQIYPQFNAIMRIGGNAADERVEQTLYEVATGWEYDEHVKTTEIDENGMPYEKLTTITKKARPDMAGIKYWLGNKRPAKWRERQDVVVTHNVNLLTTADLNAIVGEIIEAEVVQDEEPAKLMPPL